jgi:two-component system sensor histidine kinase KdpD
MVGLRVVSRFRSWLSAGSAANEWRTGVRSAWPARYGLALLGVVCVTVVISQLGGLHLANTSMLYLIVVLVAAVALGRGPAVFSAVVAFLGVNFFHTEPRYTFFVADPDEWIALLLFLLTAIVTGQLAAGQRRRADEAEEHERQARVLYDIAAAVAEPRLDRALEAIADRLRTEFGVAGVKIAVGASGSGRMASATSSEGPEAVAAIEDRDAGPMGVLAPAAPGASDPGRWIRVSPPHGSRRPRASTPYRLARVPIRSPQGDAGEIVLAADAHVTLDARAARLLSAVAAQLWVALERARLREEATEAEVLRRSDEAKSALLDAVSHDLRTPLASIIASAGSLRQTGVEWSADERQGFAAAIEQEAERLDRIVGNLLDLGRLRAGAIHPDTAWYEPVTLIREVVGRLAPLTARHEMRLDLPDELPPVAMDYSKVDQILTNLVENAAKYSPAGGEIRVAAAIDDGALRVSVTDSGPGIDPRAFGRIFQPFYRIGRPRQPGTGLGLALASGLVQAHGGRIWAEQPARGGTRFVFTIPTDERAP